jgi:hypothetical protein
VFVGHFALGFAAKGAAPAVSLGAIFAAVQFADLLWPNLLLLGYERVEIAPGDTVVTPLRFVWYPYSHSLVAAVMWAILVGIAYRLVRRSTIAAALVLAGLVVSHWGLDALAHRPDLPLTLTGSTRVGLGLWNSVELTIMVEALALALGVWVYLGSTAALDRIGSLGLWGLVGFLAVAYLTAIFGPPPPSVAAVAWPAQMMWLLVLWGYWVDRHRAPLSARRGQSGIG